MTSDAEAEHWLSRNLAEMLAFPPEACEWLISLWNAVQVFDDMADGDFPDRDRLDAAICDTLVNMPANPFFLEHIGTLLPLVSVAILKWKGADDVEREGEPNEVSFVWRAGYYDIVLAVVQIVHGHRMAMDVSKAVLKLYGESYAEYQAEFAKAQTDA